MLAAIVAGVPVLSVAAEPSAAKGAPIVVSDSARAEVTIIDLQRSERKVTLRDEQGNQHTMTVDAKVHNFDQIEKGDVIVIEYRRAAATMLEKTSDAEAAGKQSGVERVSSGGKPGMAATETSSIVATVLEIDVANRTLTLQGPKGGKVNVKAPADMKSFDTLKKGDKVTATYTEEMVVSVKKPETVPEKK
jgi:hypothetical protein